MSLKSFMILFCVFSVGLSLTYPTIGTNQTIFYGNLLPLINTPTKSSFFYGQDANFYSVKPKPSYHNNGDGTITDLNTGLMWQSARGNKTSLINAISGASSFRLANYTDWRMPTVKELYSLIQYTGRSGQTDATSVPYIDTNYFEIVFGDVGDAAGQNSIVGERLIDGQDFTSNIYVSTVMMGQQADFGVNFIDGRIKGYGYFLMDPSPLNNKYVRYVRGPTNYGVNNFTDNGDTTITDHATGLMWAKYDSGYGMDWQTALTWAQAQNTVKHLGFADWRVPTIKELHSIVDYTRSPDTTKSAAINAIFNCSSIINEGNATDFPYFWSGTTHLDSMGAAYISFGRALGYMQLNGNSYYTLLDVHGAGAQRSDPKSGNATSYPLGVDIKNNTVYGRGPQGDVQRIYNYVRLVRTA